MKERVAIALLRTGCWIVYVSRLGIAYLHGDKVLGTVCLALDCQQAHG